MSLDDEHGEWIDVPSLDGGPPLPVWVPDAPPPDPAEILAALADLEALSLAEASGQAPGGAEDENGPQRTPQG